MRLGLAHLSRRWRYALAAAGLACAGVAALGLGTAASLQPFPASLHMQPGEGRIPRLMDREGRPLGGPLVAGWNVYDAVPLSSVPEFLQAAFLMSEDQRFYVHGGPDWRARSHALWQNLTSLGVVRGASTVSEQVVRILHPRPRTYWSRWVEGFEAAELEQRFSKADILEFYLNEVPYASGRRGVVQAARGYFDRDLETLSRKEMLTLAVLVRAPSAYDLWHGTHAVETPVQDLGAKLRDAGFMTDAQFVALPAEPYRLEHPPQLADAPEFSDYIGKSHPPLRDSYVQTSLDLDVQRRVQALLDQRLKQLSNGGIHDAAALVVDNRDDSIVAWVVGSVDRARKPVAPGTRIDAVLTPRQPGSTLKPFLYGLALEKGWSPATLIDDSRIVEAVGHGLHTFRNYSGEHYGHITLRDALGNSLNIPAVRTVEFVTPPLLLATLQRLGIDTLDQDPDYYGDALALGDGEVSLYGLVQAYSALARQGEFLPLTAYADTGAPRRADRIYSPEASSLIANILSDPGARRLEFGQAGLLEFPVQTAVKTGTSSDYHDAWTVGFDSRYTVGVWMGNLDYTPMDGITGSLGPAMVTRAVFAELDRRDEPARLYLSPKLEEREICVHEDVMPKGQCLRRSEWFMPHTAPRSPAIEIAQGKPTVGDEPRVHFETPSDGLLLAYDPRIPAASQAFLMTLSKGPRYAKVAWWVDGKQAAVTDGNQYLWPVTRGRHKVSARVELDGQNQEIRLASVYFTVK
ncbi:MAG TPA: transglycosylase domain-containing protein [Gammaproteobacteria bacterium]